MNVIPIQPPRVVIFSDFFHRLFIYALLTSDTRLIWAALRRSLDPKANGCCVQRSDAWQSKRQHEWTGGKTVLQSWCFLIFPNALRKTSCGSVAHNVWVFPAELKKTTVGKQSWDLKHLFFEFLFLFGFGKDNAAVTFFPLIYPQASEIVKGQEEVLVEELQMRLSTGWGKRRLHNY